MVGSDVSKVRGSLVDFGVVESLDRLLQIGEDIIELPYCGRPVGGVEAVEGLVVVAAVFGFRLAFHLGQLLPVPENKMDGQLTDGVITASVGPLGLLD